MTRDTWLGALPVNVRRDPRRETPPAIEDAKTPRAAFWRLWLRCQVEANRTHRRLAKALFGVGANLIPPDESRYAEELFESVIRQVRERNQEARP